MLPAMATIGTRLRSLGTLAQGASRVLHGKALTRHAMDEKNRLQIYVSRSMDPYLNLATEQHLLEVSHPSSTVLFLYRNLPSVIIGRSQNPWLEVNLERLREGLPRLKAVNGGGCQLREASKQTTESSEESQNNDPLSLGPIPDLHNVPVSLVRRRSGGGTVFHDPGNVNWSVIFPTSEFDRDRHAEMVVRALRDRIGVPSVRVNDRHDIVMDVPEQSFSEEPKTFKVSGSAYRVTRLRSLHHGTCLVSSPYVSQISPLLRPPLASTYLKTRGAGSVRSPVRNVSGGTHADAVVFDTCSFIDMVIDEFRTTYSHLSALGNDLVYRIDPSVMDIPDVQKGFKELSSPQWVFCQTPQFTFSTYSTETDPRERPPSSSAGLSPNFKAHMTIRHGKIIECDFRGLDSDLVDKRVSEGLVGTDLHEISDWNQTLLDLSHAKLPDADTGTWLNNVFGNRVP